MMNSMNLALVLSAVACFACSAPSIDQHAGAAGATVPVTPSPAIDPRVDEILTAASERFGALTAYRLRVSDTQDVLDDSGQMLQYAALREVVVRRPDRVWAQTTGDLMTRTLWKDGTSVTLYEPEQEVYGRIDDPGTLEQMMDVLLDTYGFSTPLADLLSPDMHAVFTDGVLSADYLGKHLVGEERCHHLAFDHPEIDFQLWYSIGDSPQLRKIVITETNAPGSPQYTMWVQAVEALDAADVPDAFFMPQIPDDAEEIEIVPLDAADQDR